MCATILHLIVFAKLIIFLQCFVFLGPHSQAIALFGYLKNKIVTVDVCM